MRVQCLEQHWAHGKHNVSVRLNYCFEIKLKLSKAQRPLENLEEKE
jgi:hypothetical protein